MILHVVYLHQYLQQKDIIIVMREAAAFLFPSELPLHATGEQENTTLKRRATSKFIICDVGAECGKYENTGQGKAPF